MKKQYEEKMKMPVALLPQEREEYSKQLAAICHRIIEIEKAADEARGILKKCKKQIIELRKNEAQIATIIHKGFHDKEIDVIKEIDYEAGKATIFRKSDKYTILTREINDDEKQLKADLK